MDQGLYNQPTRDPIEIRLTPTQRVHYLRQTGMVLPSSLSLPPAQLKRLASVAVKAGTETLPISRSAAKQVLEPKSYSERGSDSFAVEVSLTSEQKEQIRQATCNVFSGGALITSGSVVARAKGAANAVCAAGFSLEERRSQDNWVGRVFRKP